MNDPTEAAQSTAGRDHPPKTVITLEPGIFKRVDPRTGRVLSKLWIHYPGKDGKTEREPTHTTSIVAARKLRAKRLEQHGRGEAGRAAERVRVRDILADLKVNYEVNARASVRTIAGHLKHLEAVAALRAIELTTDRVQSLQRTWQQTGLTNATINRICTTLGRAFVLAVRGGKLHVRPYIPRLTEEDRRGRYMAPGDADAIRAALPTYVQPLFAFAGLYGTRKGQLARTQRRFVDLDRSLIEWPAGECKHREPHVLPLDEDGLALVDDLMADARPWCPYLFHGPRCAPGVTPSKIYGCVGDFKKAWRSACNAAGFPLGRRAGGYVFHHTRNTAATNLRAGGMDEADAMKITGHQTAHVFRHYDLGDVDKLRERLARSRTYVQTLRAKSKVTPLRRHANDSDEQRVTGQSAR